MTKAEKILKEIAAWPSRYETAEGKLYRGELCSKFKVYPYEAKQLGLVTVQAQYVGVARKTGKFVDIIVLEEIK